MSINTNILKVTVAAAGVSKLITPTDPYEEYVLEGTATLVGNVTIATSGAPTSPKRIRVMYKSVLTLNGFSVTLFGNVLNNQQALSGNVIVDAIWDGAQWLSWIVDTFVAPNYEGFRTVPVNLAGATVNITNADKQVQYFTGTGNLLGNYSVTFSGTFREGQTFFLKFAATLTIGASIVTIFGENLNATQALGGNCTVIAWYDLANTTFRTQIIASPPSASGFNTPSLLAVPVIGINYPAATAGDVFKIVCAGEEGRIGAVGVGLPYPEPPLCKRVYNDQMVYCLTSTAGGNEAAAGASFWSPGWPPAFVPFDTVNGSSNFRINVPGNPSTPNSIGAGVNIGNGFVGASSSAGNASVYNWLVGLAHVLNGTLNSIIAGRAITSVAGSNSNLLTGFLSSISGLNNIMGGQLHSIVGSNSMITGESQTMVGAAQSTSMRAVLLGAGVEARHSNGVYMGSGAVGPAGSTQAIVLPLAGSTSAVMNPLTSGLSISTSIFPSTNDSLSLSTNSTLWSFEIRVIVGQSAVGVNHTNTSAVGDWVEFVVTGVLRRSSAGTLTLANTKWLDHRNRWIPTATPSPVAFRNRVVANGTRADLCLIKPSITASGSTMSLGFIFPGFAEVMVDNGANTTPRFAVYAAVADVPLPVINTGVAADDGIIKNTLTTTLAPLLATTFRNPLVDIFDGNDTAGTGYFGGIGIGATATAETKLTGIADIGLGSGGSYNAAVTATITFAFGDATATSNMSAQSDHIGNNVGFTAGNYGAPNGIYPFTFAGGTGSGAAGYATITGGIVTATIISNGGTGYTTGDVVTLTIPTALPVTTPAVFTPTLYFSVISVNITAPGTLYRNTSNLGVTFAGAGLAQATGTAQIIPVPITDAGAADGSITVTAGGKGYGIGRPNVAVYDGGGTNFDEGNGGSYIAQGIMTIAQLKYA